MEKTATLNLRINPEVKRNAEEVLEQLGIPMSTAIDMYLRQIAYTGGIPFAARLPQAPRAVDADRMTDAELTRLLASRLDEARSEAGVPLAEVAAELLA